MNEAVDRAGAQESEPADAGRERVSGRSVWADSATRAFLIYAAVLAVFATPLLTGQAALGSEQWAAYPIALTVAAGIAATLLLSKSALTHWAHTLWNGLARPDPRWFWYCMGGGVALRFAWVALFPAAPMSDGATYLMLAKALASGEPYEMEGTRAYWPPGYPIWLAAWLAVFGDERLAVTGSNLVLFALGLAGVRRAADMLAGPQGAVVAGALFAVWPNHVAFAGCPEKEQLLVALLPWIVVMLARAVATPSRARHWIGAGALAGVGALVQPSLLLLPVLVSAFAAVAVRPARRAALGALLFTAAMASLIAPWTVRNHQALDAFVPVTSNGGGNFYRANNPLATGGYVAKGEVDLSDLPEVEADRRGRQLALQWIRANPAEFLRLGLWKQVLFMGDDAAGVYTSVRLGRGSSSAVVYVALKLAANAFWMAYWAAILVVLIALAQRQSVAPVTALLPPWLFLYFFGLHSVFESGGKYHVALIGMFPVILATYAARAFGRSDE
jgi:hypothetical protein